MFEGIYLDTVLSTVLVYAFIIIGMRLLGKKELGQLSIADLIFIMLISEAVGKSMLGSNDNFLGGIIAAATLMIGNKILEYFQYKSKKFQGIMEGQPALLVRNGKIIEKEMKKNKIKISDLEEVAREKGIGNISSITMAILETDGKISILTDKDIKFSEDFER